MGVLLLLPLRFAIDRSIDLTSLIFLGPSNYFPSLTPSKVEDFVRKGPGWEKAPHYLFTLRLEDDYGVVEAVAAGPDAARLLPGAPSPAEFHSSAEVRARVERVLARLEAAGAAGGNAGVVGLRLRSYLAPLVGVGQRGEKCKRYSIIAPSRLESG